MAMRRLTPLLALPLLIGAAPQSLERRVVLSGFDKIRVDGPWQVEVTSGGTTGATLTGDRPALERVQVRQEGSTLIVSPVRGADGAWRGGAAPAPDGPIIRVSARALTGASLNGAGTLSIDRIEGARVQVAVNGAGRLSVGDIDADDLNATVIGPGAMTLAGTVRRARILSNAGGSITGFSLVADEALVRSEGTGTIQMTARYRANISGLGLGSITIGGNPECRISGPAPIQCGKGGGR